MTHGTDRDTPTGGADRDSADVPGGRVTGAPREGVPQPHDAPEAVAPVAPVDGADDATAEAPADDSAPAADDARGDDARGDDAGTGDDVPAATTPDAPAVATPDPPPDAAPDRPRATTPPSIPPPVARPRPLAPEPAAPLAAWPSWDDVAVTAPPAEPAAPQAARTEEVAPEPDGAAAGSARQDAGAPQSAPPSDAGSPAEPTSDDAGPEAVQPSAAGSDDREQDAEPPAAAPSSPAPAAAPAGAAPLPPLDLGGLSALAFTALNAASVGVPAHALPKSDVPQPGTASDASDADASDADASDADASDADADASESRADTDPTAPDADATARSGGDAHTEDAVEAPAASEHAAGGPDGADAPAAEAAPGPDAPQGADASGDESGAASSAPVASEQEAPEPAPAAAPAGTGPAVDEEATGTPDAEPPAVPEAPPAERTAVLPPAARADETAVTPPAPRADETAVTPPTPRADETAVVPPATADGAEVATRATPVAPTVPPRRTSALGGTTVPAPPAGPDAPELEGEADDASPLAVFEPEPTDRRWPRVLAITGGALALLAAVYAGSSYALADRVPRGATVGGVEIGGLSSEEAEQRLQEGLAERASSPLAVVAQDVQTEIDPVAAGLELDAAATVARLTGVNLAEPARVWRHVVGVGEQRPVTVVDEAALDAALTQLTGSLVLAPVDGTVVFADGAAHATDAVDGWELDTEGAAGVLEDGWLTAAEPVELPTSVVAPAVTQEETDRALAELARPLVAAPVTVQVADRQAVLDVATLTAHAAVVPVEGRLELQLDGEALSQAVLGQLPDLLTSASDARFEFRDGAPVIVPGTPGTTLDPAALSASVAQAATAGEGRLAAVELVESDPAETTAGLEALGVKEIVSEFSTPLTSEPRRTSNIATGLRNITGTLVRPGEVFSLTEALGPVDAAHGFVQAGAIVNGEHTDAWGGGLSQVSTTAFNAAYFAGYEDVEHKPHSEWFQRYPEGREATIFTGVIDMKWRNNTPYGALVQGFVADGRAHVRIWSTKHFTVETEKSGRSGVVAPTTVYSQSRTCEPQSAGNPGFTVTNTRKVYLDGELVATEPYTWRYKPQNKVVCGTPPAAGEPAP